MLERFYVLKLAFVDKLNAHCERGLSKMKFNLLEHISEDVSRFCLLKYLQASPF